jgi:hypothetical protein
MVRHYGERLFKCQYMYCSFRRHGFESKASRNSHEKEHEKPWNCYVEGCEFEKGGFLSRKMRDEHLERFHTHPDDLPKVEFEKLEDVDLENVCLDLVKADDVSRIRELAAAGKIGAKPCLYNLMTCAAQYASPEMIKILVNQKVMLHDHHYGRQHLGKLLLPETVAGNNYNMLEYILNSTADEWNPEIRHGFYYYRDRGLAEVMAKANDEMLHKFCRWVEQNLLQEKTTRYLVSSNMIAATAGDVYREQILLGFWRKIPCLWWAKNFWKNAIINVASTTCSIELAKFLTNQGVPVDWRNTKAAPTPLVHAARKTNSEAAELVRFLILNGADTVVEMVKRKYDVGKRSHRDLVKSHIHVSEERGARQISKWLGVTFDELVAQAKKAEGKLENSET